MTPEVRITRRATFAAGHILCRDDWTDEKNREVFGACSTDHGHNYVIEVTVGGTVDPGTGMVVNLKHVDTVLRRGVRGAGGRPPLKRGGEFIDGAGPPPAKARPAAAPRPGGHLQPGRPL